MVLSTNHRLLCVFVPLCESTAFPRLDLERRKAQGAFIPSDRLLHHYCPCQRFGLLQVVLGDLVDGCRTYPAGADQMALGKAVPLEEFIVTGVNVSKQFGVRVSLGDDENQFLAGGEAGWVGIGDIIRDQIGKGPVDETFELA